MNDYVFEYDYQEEVHYLFVSAWSERDARDKWNAIRITGKYTGKIAVPKTALGVLGEVKRRLRLWTGL